MDDKRTDTANEPVDDNEFMDTGVLHEKKVLESCTDESCTQEHPHPTPKEAQ